MLMFAFATTMAMIQVAQYVAFSTARVHSAGHLTQDKQVQHAQEKFKTFTDPKHFPALAPLLRNGWFEIDTGSLEIKGGGNSTAGGGNFDTEYGYSANPPGIPQQGIRFIFRAPVLKFNIPLIGSVKDEEDADFGTFITGLIFREPTSAECRAQLDVNVRFRALRELDNRYNSIYQSGMWGGRHSPTPTAYIPLEDNGC